MVIYEVNLNVDKEIFEAFRAWLDDHIKSILKLPGFIQAHLCQESDHPDHARLCIHYLLATQQDMDNYLNHHAEAMRADGLSKFGGQFSAQRRILNSLKEYTA